MNVLKFLNNWIFKALAITVVPFLIGLIDSSTEWKNIEGNYTNIFTNGKIFVISLSLLYIAYVIYLAYIEKKEIESKQNIKCLEEKINKLEIYKDVYSSVYASLNALMNTSQININDLSKKIMQTDNLELLNWNFESIANCICRDVVNVLEKIAKQGNDITVNIYIRFKKKVGRKNQDCIKMVAHAGGSNSLPAIFYTDILLSKKRDWQYAKLFLDNNPKIIVYLNEEEIVQKFKFKDNTNKNKYAGEYTQYIGIPISCASGNIISAMEIVSHHGTIIADTKEELLNIINKYIIIYRNYALLTHKIEKGLKAKRVAEKEGNDNAKK